MYTKKLILIETAMTIIITIIIYFSQISNAYGNVTCDRYEVVGEVIDTEIPQTTPYNKQKSINITIMILEIKNYSKNLDNRNFTLLQENNTIVCQFLYIFDYEHGPFEHAISSNKINESEIGLLTKGAIFNGTLYYTESNNLLYINDLNTNVTIENNTYKKGDVTDIFSIFHLLISVILLLVFISIISIFIRRLKGRKK